MTWLYVLLLFAVTLATLLVGAAVLLVLIGAANRDGPRRHAWLRWLRQVLCPFFFDCFDKKDGDGRANAS